MNKSDIKPLLAQAGLKIEWGNKAGKPYKITASTGESVQIPVQSLNGLHTSSKTPASVALRLLDKLLMFHQHLQREDAIMQARLGIIEGVRYE